jgi:hypothetical protein
MQVRSEAHKRAMVSAVLPACLAFEEMARERYGGDTIGAYSGALYECVVLFYRQASLK